MGWDVGYSGDCPACGAGVHHVAKDMPGMTTVWLRCPKCLRASSEHVGDGVRREFWRASHPCPTCKAPREPWEPSRCARCGREDAGAYVCVPD